VCAVCLVVLSWVVVFDWIMGWGGGGWVLLVGVEIGYRGKWEGGLGGGWWGGGGGGGGGGGNSPPNPPTPPNLATCVYTRLMLLPWSKVVTEFDLFNSDQGLAHSIVLQSPGG